MSSNVKKIFDIAPPGKKVAEEIKEHQLPAALALAKKPSAGKKFMPLIIGIVLLIAVVLSYLTIPHKAKIELWPEKKTLEGTVAITVSADRTGANFVRGKILESEKTVSQNFTAQGKRLSAANAQGTIRIYNNYSTSGQVLVATTRFLSDDGKLLRTVERVTVPGGYYEGGKFVAGFIDAKVVADQPGEEYNIDKSTFSIPGFAGTPKYTSFYGKSFSPMSGGVKKEVSYVTQQDVDMAKEILAKSALAENDAALRGAVSEGRYTLMNGTIFAKASGFKTSVEAGQEADNFSTQIGVAAKAVVFREQDLADFSKNYIGGKLAEGERLIESSLKAEYSLEKADLGRNELYLKVLISAQSHSIPEDIKLKEMVSKKNIKEIEAIFREFPRIIKAKIEFWPFWVNLAPDNLKGIDIILHL